MRVFSLTPGSELKRIVKVLYREAIIWRSLSHENILPLVGIDAGSQSPCPCILVSPWMDNGNVNDYVRSQALSNQQVVQLLREVSCALGYLHDRQIVHGDIRGGNILVDENGHAKLMDFGLAFASEMTQSTVASGSPRWMAPELHDPKSFGLASGVKLPPTDVYGFAFTCLEVYTGQRPFPELSEISALIAVIAGQRPDRPSAEECGRFFSDRFWCLLEKCWSHQPEARPSSQDVCATMTALLTYESDIAMQVSEQNIPETRLTAFIPPEQIPSPDLSDAVTITSKLPMDTFLPYSDTYKGELFNKFGQRTSVTCRAMRLYARGPSEVVLIGQVIKREVLFWPQLAHVNVVPFLGTCNIDTHLSFVYPFYELGTLGAYIRNYPKADRQSLLRDVAQGMAFIHSQNLVHGDLTPDSVLVDDTKTARLFNFGFTGVEGDRTPTPLRAIRYMAPETYGIDPRGVPVPHHRMKASDVYAFGILAYTVLMGRVPWPRLTELQVFARIFHGERPENPDGRIPLSLWKLIQNCWAEDPYARPTMSAIVQQLNTNTRSSLSRWRQSLF
ncbi:hypothetical protein JAAARDRAFT_306463 [Jaapia argillacea MUCL 33604]|uniref:Protein kinase domain-containing protein n=1 Tax=Jaapia argillacea MUCL 33604 TaxID=933084 RepID=A0A067PR12_9AGAM|nr:hypothetical protein JAAARDRAFT_306463 [Jaapia argillacea MUCL 33604]